MGSGLDHRIVSLLATASLLLAASGCCGPYPGWVLKGDVAIECNRVSALASRGDCYDGGCEPPAEGGEFEYGESPHMAPLDPGFHPVPTREMFHPPGGPYTPPAAGPTPAEPLPSVLPEGEEIPLPPGDRPAAAPRRLGENSQRASWSFGRTQPRKLGTAGSRTAKPRRQVEHVWRPTRP